MDNSQTADFKLHNSIEGTQAKTSGAKFMPRLPYEEGEVYAHIRAFDADPTEIMSLEKHMGMTPDDNDNIGMFAERLTLECHRILELKKEGTEEKKIDFLLLQFLGDVGECCVLRNKFRSSFEKVNGEVLLHWKPFQVYALKKSKYCDARRKVLAYPYLDDKNNFTDVKQLDEI